MKYQFRTKSTEMPVGKLRLSNSTNREVQPTRVRYFVQNMNPDALGRFAVWQDGRNLYLIDGQHRKLALEELGVPDWPVRCDIYSGMSFQDACQQFLDLNNQLTVNAFDKFDKGVKSGQMDCVESKRIVENAGFTIKSSRGENSDGDLSAVQAIRDVWKLDQGEALEQALALTIGAWGHTSAAAEGHVIRGLGAFAHRYNGDVDTQSLVKKLAKYPGGPRNLLGAAKQRKEFKGGSIAKNFASIMVDVYNKGRRTGELEPL